jgi:hypothetical protein
VLAYAGVSPRVVPVWSTFGTLLVKHRAITLTGETLTVWNVYSGPTPAGAPIGTHSVDDLSVEFGLNWNTVLLGDRRLWVRQNQRSTLEEWLALGSDV